MDDRSDWRGKRVTVMGLGTRGGGSGVARYLVNQGAIVTVTDLHPEEELAEQIAELADVDIRFVLGKHEPADFTDADAVVRNPAVRRNNQYLALARDAGVPIEMEMTIFLRACPARVIGITGTKGKTTTSALCAAMLLAHDPNTVSAGNMGVSALAQLPAITSTTPVVLEISSWQLEAMDEAGIGPNIAVLTNISEDHLDTYGGFEEYAATKRSIARNLHAGDALVLNAGDPEVMKTERPDAVRVISCGRDVTGQDTVRISDDELVSSIHGASGRIPWPLSTALRGAHQRKNAALAAAAALTWGASIGDVERGLNAFSGVANRMEVVAEIDGVQFINDTAATAPAATIASLLTWSDRPVHLIAGGADKQLHFATLAAAIIAHATTVTLLDGTATPHLIRELLSAGWTRPLPVVGSMIEAIESAEASAEPGSVILLSPGCASFGLFRDEFDRGDQFRRIVQSRIRREIL